MRPTTLFVPVVALLAFEANAASSVRANRPDGSSSSTPRYDVAPPTSAPSGTVQQQAPARPILLNANAAPSLRPHPRMTPPIVPPQQQALSVPETREVSPAPAPPVAQTSPSRAHAVPLAPKPAMERPVTPRTVVRPVVQSKPRTVNVRVAEYPPRRGSSARVFRLQPIVPETPLPQYVSTTRHSAPALNANETAGVTRQETGGTGQNSPTLHRSSLPVAEKPVTPAPPQPRPVVAVEPQPAPTAVQRRTSPVSSNPPARPVVVTAPRQTETVPAPKPPVPVARQIAPARRAAAPVAQPTVSPAVAPAPRPVARQVAPARRAAAPVAQPTVSPAVAPTPRPVARQVAPVSRAAAPVAQPAVAPQPSSKRPRRRLPIAPVNDTTNLPPVPSNLLSPAR